MKKVTKNIIFILIVVGLMLGVAVHNYFFDNNNLFSKKNKLNIYHCSNKYMNLCMNEEKHLQNELLFTGASELMTFQNSKQLFYNMPIYKYSYKGFYKLLEYYLSLHPETQKVVLFLSPNLLFYKAKNEEEISTSNNENMFFKKLKLLFDIHSLFEHIKYFQMNRTKLSYGNYSRVYYPFNARNYTNLEYTYKDLQEENKIYLKKIIDLLESKNISYTFIIPPNNAINTAIMYLAPEYYNAVEDFKRYIVNNFGTLYDYTRLNKYTSMNLLDGSNYLWRDPMHCNQRFGIKFINDYFFDYKQGDDFYYIDTKENLEENLKAQRNEIENYIKENREYVDLYLERMGKNWDFHKVTEDKDYPEDVKIDQKYFEEHMKKLNYDTSIFIDKY